jgi:hypothetical protein
MLDGALKPLGVRINPSCRFVCNDTQAVTPFAAESMNQAAGFFVSQTAGFASAIAQNRPKLSF